MIIIVSKRQTPNKPKKSLKQGNIIYKFIFTLFIFILSREKKVKRLWFISNHGRRRWTHAQWVQKRNIQQTSTGGKQQWKKWELCIACKKLLMLYVTSSINHSLLLPKPLSYIQVPVINENMDRDLEQK